MNPIWKDYHVLLSTGNSARYSIVDASGNTIYTGKANKRPGDANISIRINEVCADHIPNTLPATTGTFVNGGEASFIVNEILSDGETDERDSVSFLQDYSYDRSFNPTAGQCISFPIIGRADIRQTLPFSFYQVEEGELSIYYEFEDESSEDFYFDGNGTGTILQKPYAGVTKIAGWYYASYEILRTCSKYALLYRNAFGGWDSFLIEGNTMETDSLERHTRSKEYDNSNSRNAGKENYLTQVVKNFTFHTGFLTDMQSARMPHLLNSAEVYLENLEDGSLTPVILTNTDTEYKTYRNTASLVNYEIAVEVAHDYIRR